MANHLYEYLRFFRDLGVEEIYLPRSARQRLTRRRRAEAASPAGDAKVAKGPLQQGSPRAGARSKAAPAPVTPKASPPLPKPPAPKVRVQGLFSKPSSGDPPKVLQEIQEDIGDCTRCRLHEGRSTIVFGSGNPNAKLVFVGEGPGADEDAQGLPFVGRAGQLLTQMINNTAKREGIPITREDVYICNVVKCRPPGNRAPESDEMQTCGQFLERQIEAIRPKAICVLGGTAAKYLLKSSQGITKMRGEWQEWNGIPVMPTYHPAFLIRPFAQEKKREAWQDLRAVLHYVYD